MDNPPPHAIECLKAAGRQSVWLIGRPGEEPRTLKTWPLSPALALKLLLGIAQPQRQIRATKRLTRAGLNAAPVIGRWKIILQQRIPVVQLELKFVPGRSAFELAPPRSLSDPERRRAATSIGRTVAQLTAAKLFHRDLKLSNLIIDATYPRNEVWLIDTVGVRPMRRGATQIARMLERLAVQLTVSGDRLPAVVWMPVILHALRPLPVRTRRAVVQRLKQHRSRRSGESRSARDAGRR